jgi:hypothetical protein
MKFPKGIALATVLIHGVAVFSVAFCCIYAVVVGLASGNYFAATLGCLAIMFSVVACSVVCEYLFKRGMAMFISFAIHMVLILVLTSTTFNRLLLRVP